MLSLPGPVFFSLAERLYLYPGVMAARAEEQEAESPSGPQEPPPRRAPPAEQVTPKVVLQTDAAFKGIFSFGEMQPA